MDNNVGSDESVKVGERVLYDGRRLGTVTKRGWIGASGQRAMIWTIAFDDGRVEEILCGVQPLKTSCVNCDKEILVRDLNNDYICPDCRKDHNGILAK